MIAERVLIEALHQVGQKDGTLVEDVDLAIEAIDLPRSSLLDDLEAGTELSPSELRVLLENETVDTQKVQECIRGMLVDEWAEH